MKRYIRASFDSSMPEWLRKDKWAIQALNKAGIDLQNCIFSPTKQGKMGDNYVVYRIHQPSAYQQTYSYKHSNPNAEINYNDFIWIPGIYNDDHYVGYINYNRYNPYAHEYEISDTAVKYFAKKDLNIIDTVYIYKATNQKPRREHYTDPRYGTEWGKSGDQYLGQRFIPEKKSYDGKITPAHWSESGISGRDKSGYAIPNPKDRLRAFHNSPEGKTRQAEKCRKQLEQIYGQLVSLKDDILENLNNSSMDNFGSKYRALDYFNDALNYYKEALKYITPQRYWNTENYTDPESALRSAERALDRIDSARKIIDGKSNW